MIARLTWDYAEPDKDKDDLRSFCCTRPKQRSVTHPSRFVYPRPPERQPEKIIHELNLRKAERTGQRVWIGRDCEGVAAVVSWRWIGEDVVQVCVVALALRVRGNGFALSAEMVDSASAQVAGEAAERGLESAFVTAYIHKDNRASRAFAARFKMEQLGEPDRDGFALHSIELPFADI